MNIFILVSILFLLSYNLGGFHLKYLKKKYNKEFKSYYKLLVYIGYIGVSVFIIGIIDFIIN